MKGREPKGGIPPADLLVCFPSRAHLSPMPKLICSPARRSEPTKRHHKHRLLKNPATRSSHGSPLLLARTKPMESEIAEPTSPKVTCAGQIKVRPKTTTSCKSWQSVMEEIQRIHDDGKSRKGVGSVDVVGLKKDSLQFLTCWRSIKYRFGCFRAFPESDIMSDEEEEEAEETAMTSNENSRIIFPEWFMVLQENQKNELSQENNGSFPDASEQKAPPPNALLLMRCRSAPAKTWQEEEEEEEEGKEKEKAREGRKSKSLRTLMEEENKSIKKKKLSTANYDLDSYKFSSDVVKETWIGGDSFSRSQSWKRW